MKRKGKTARVTANFKRRPEPLETMIESISLLIPLPKKEKFTHSTQNLQRLKQRESEILANFSGLYFLEVLTYFPTKFIDSLLVSFKAPLLLDT